MLRSKDVWFCPECKIDCHLPEDNSTVMYVKDQRKYSLENKWGDLEYFYMNTWNWKRNQCGNKSFAGKVINELCAYRWGDPIQTFTKRESEDEADWHEWLFNVEKAKSTMQSTQALFRRTFLGWFGYRAWHV